MQQRTRNISLAVLIGIVIVTLGVSIFYTPADHENQDIDIVGSWYLVNSFSYDGDAKMYNTINENYNMDIKSCNDDGVFYGTVQSKDFVGVYIDGNFIVEYSTDNGSVRMIGYASDGYLKTKEVHYYETNAEHVWFVSENIYSKDPQPLSLHLPAEPEVNTSWNSWEGHGLNVDGMVDLAGHLFKIQQQQGNFLRVEMEQIVGSNVVTKVLNGIIVNSYTINGEKTWMAYLVDSEGALWNLYIRDDAAILRTATTSELAGHEGEITVVQRVYVNTDLVGPPKELMSTDDLLGYWVKEFSNTMMGDGNQYHSQSNAYLDIDVKSGTLFAGERNNEGKVIDTLAYSVVNLTVDSGYMYHLIFDDGGDISTGYGMISDDGNKLCLIEFWYDEEKGMNAVTYHVYDKTH